MLALSLGGCDSIRRGLGMEKALPDEFAVVSRAPLAIPPDFALRPPKAGAPRTQDVAPVDQARQSVFRAGQQAALPPAQQDRSAGEGILLRQAGATNVEPSIRETVNEENQASSLDTSGGFVDKLLFWRDQPKTAPTNRIINAQDEAQRLKDQAENGAAPSSAPDPADVPTITRKSSTATVMPSL